MPPKVKSKSHGKLLAHPKGPILAAPKAKVLVPAGAPKSKGGSAPKPGARKGALLALPTAPVSGKQPPSTESADTIFARGGLPGFPQTAKDMPRWFSYAEHGSSAYDVSTGRIMDGDYIEITLEPQEDSVDTLGKEVWGSQRSTCSALRRCWMTRMGTELSW